MKKFTAIICFALFIAVWAVAQDAAPRFAIYEDQVKPSMSAPYKDALKKLKAHVNNTRLASHGLQ